MTDNPKKRPRGDPFTKGNAGRPAGSKNRKTQILGSLSNEDQDRLIRRAYEVAMEGEPQLLKFFLARILPKDRLIQIDEVPMGLLADEAPDVIAATLKAVCSGKITPAEGAAVAGVANQYARALEIADIILRLDTVEAKQPNDRR
jgi:hypothetical protein